MSVPEPLPESLPWNTGEQSGAFLGVQSRENDSGSLEDLFFSPGVRVVRVIENSPAASAGIEPGDVLLSFNEVEVNDPGTLAALLARLSGKESARIEVRREDTVLELTVGLVQAGAGSAEGPEFLYRLDRARSAAGWATDRGGVRLVSANDSSPVFEAGLVLGDLVTAIDGVPVHSDRDLIRRLVALEPGSTVNFKSRRSDGSKRTVAVDLLKSPTYMAGFGIPILVNYAHDPDHELTDFVFIDLWIVSLFEYHRDGKERTWSFLKYLWYASGVGELAKS